MSTLAHPVLNFNPLPPAYAKNDLVSHAGEEQECHGIYNENTKIGWGPAYQNACAHSGSNDYTGGDTVWYNYVTASAGTIIDENTDASNPVKNTTTATESVCPKGWTLPSKIQSDNNKNLTTFSPVYGGIYGNGTLYHEATRGTWWSSEALIPATRYYLNLQSGTLSTLYGLGRLVGLYIRCVSEEKTVTDLTYMQDMTPSIADWAPPL